ncbi:hypothetical protein [Stenotrophomonas phage StenR_269]|nr:hypothetical protein [Stenotrophomonas phage StenR_269]
MNREQAKQLLPLITAFAEGKEIQFRNYPQGMWHPSVEPGWNGDVEYRIKPEPVVVEKWAAIRHQDGNLFMFDSEKDANIFAKSYISATYTVFMMRGTYER